MGNVYDKVIYHQIRHRVIPLLVRVIILFVSDMIWLHNLFVILLIGVK